jgi:hypothetical protein
MRYPIASPPTIFFVICKFVFRGAAKEALAGFTKGNWRTNGGVGGKSFTEPEKVPGSFFDAQERAAGILTSDTWQKYRHLSA